MDITIINTSYVKVAVVDTVQSIIWNERYDEAGTFEIYVPVTTYYLDIFKIDYFVSIPYSDKTMIIESIEIRTDLESGDKLIVRGRSLESILDRRVVRSQTIIDTVNLDSGLATLVLAAFVNVGGYTTRLVSNFAYTASTDPTITTTSMKGQFAGENIYDVVSQYCQGYGFGFKIILDSNNDLVYSLYRGTDRSYSQSTNPYVIFSPKYDNLKSANYLESRMAYKNYSRILLYNEFDQLLNTAIYLESPAPSGLNHREIFTDARDISPFYEGTNDPIPGMDLLNQAWNRGRLDLFMNAPVISFDGIADTTNSYKYRTDYFLGDIVQIEDSYGHTGKSRITEVTIFEDPNGLYVYPTFKKI